MNSVRAQSVMPQARQGVGLAGKATATLCVALIALFLLKYPLGIGVLSGLLAVYAVALWRWPGSWLVVLPAVIPGFDLAPWSGWTMTREADPFILATVAILALRDPPSWNDVLPKGPSKAVVLLSAAALVIACAIGLTARQYTLHSDFVAMRPDNALRAVKGFATALVLLPFFRHRNRMRDDAQGLFAFGVLLGLCVVAAEIFLERAVFVGAFDITGSQAISGPFAGMNLGGDHLVVYVTMALPFALLRRRPSRLAGSAILNVMDLAVTYVLIATFSIVAYAAATISALLIFFGSAEASVDPGRAPRDGGKTPFQEFFRAAYILALMLAAMAMLLGDQSIRDGRANLIANIAERQQALSRKLELRDQDFATAVFGMGLGTYPRVAASRAGGDGSDFSVNHDDDANGFLSLATGKDFYFGQKIPVLPGPDYKLSLSVRSADGKAHVVAVMCEKFLLASRHCVGHDFKPDASGKWESFSAALSTVRMEPHAGFGPIRRPIDLSFHTSPLNDPIDIKAVHLTGPDGRDLIANGDFASGTDRWYFSDDNHDNWQILNQYKMIQFESGFLGLAAFIVLIGAAMIGARRAMCAGDKVAAAVFASLVTFVFLCFFESPLQSPGIAVIFYLICFSGLLMLERGTYRAYLTSLRPAWRRTGIGPGAVA